MKMVDIIVAVLLIIGGLNWGLIGFFRFDLVAAIFGEMTFLARLIYIIVGLAALYEVLSIKRWDIHIHRPAHA
mgnify:CR=1 FL=1